MPSKKMHKPTAQTAGSPVALNALLRSGGGTHGDRRLRRQRTRGTQLRVALRDA